MTVKRTKETKTVGTQENELFVGIVLFMRFTTLFTALFTAVFALFTILVNTGAGERTAFI